MNHNLLTGVLKDNFEIPSKIELSSPHHHTTSCEVKIIYNNKP